MRLLLSLFLLLFNCTLSAEESDFSLVNFSKTPFSKIAGNVNVVSGHYIEQDIDHTPSGPDTIPVAHAYVSSLLEEGSLADGWDLFIPSTLELFQPRGVQYVKKGPCAQDQSTQDFTFEAYKSLSNKATLFYRDAGGATVVFEGNDHARHFEPKLKKTGYMLISSIADPLRRDIHRTKIHYHSPDDSWQVTLGDDTIRTYSRTDRHKHRPRPEQKSYYKRCYHIKREELPSGNIRHYTYDSDRQLKRITTTTCKGQKLFQLFFKWKKDRVVVSSSDNLSTIYYLKKLREREDSYTISKISRPDAGTLRYHYCDKTTKHERRVQTKITASGRPELIRFYHKGKVHSGRETIHVDHKNSKLLNNRVRELLTKSLPGEKLHLSHSFLYSQTSQNQRARIRDSDNYNSVYCWNSSTKRPISLRRYTPQR